MNQCFDKPMLEALFWQIRAGWLSQLFLKGWLSWHTICCCNMLARAAFWLLGFWSYWFIETTTGNNMTKSGKTVTNLRPGQRRKHCFILEHCFIVAKTFESEWCLLENTSPFAHLWKHCCGSKTCFWALSETYFASATWAFPEVGKWGRKQCFHNYNCTSYQKDNSEWLVN